MLFHIILAFLSTLINNVSSNFYIKSTAFGGYGGISFNKNKYYAGIVIQKLEVWQGVSMLRGIRITYSDGSPTQMGKREDRYTSFELDYDNGERVTSLSVWNNHVRNMDFRNARCGAFKIVTNKGREFFPQMTGRELEMQFWQSPGGGIILGLHGKHGSDIDSLGFIMIRPIQSMILQNINYNMNQLMPPTKTSLIDQDCPNPSTEVMIGGTRTVSMNEARSGQWYISGDVSFGQTFLIETEIPKLLTETTTTTWDTRLHGEYQSSWSAVTQDSATIELICPPLSITRFMYFFSSGTISIKWSGTMVVTVDNGESWSYPVSGTYEGVDHTRIVGDSVLVANWIDNKWVYL